MSRSAVHLFSPITLRGITLRNRIGVAPMCMYSCTDGLATDWHLVHLGSRAVGGVGLVIAEATAVEARGRISPGDLGLWSDAQVEPLIPVTRFIREQGAVPAIQIAHAGRKAGTARPWEGGAPLSEAEGGWRPIVAPSAEPFASGYAMPASLDTYQIACIVRAFGDAAARAHEAGFEAVEIHGAHGYLLHQFLSPLSNHRTDGYGGGFEGRTRMVREVVAEVRHRWPERLPLLLRLSVTDWIDGGWDVEQSIHLSRIVREMGVDLIDCSSGGAAPTADMPVGPGYQAPFAQRIRAEAGIPTAAVGLITSAEQADQLIRTGQADVALLGRRMLRDPYWAVHAARSLGHELPAPVQYGRS